MAKPKTMYALKGAFSNLLEDTEKSNFMIPTYQRGFKWTSFGENNQIEVLLRDLHLAFEKSSNNRYYLQFISLKENGEELEVIDGQQRLTTLTILFSVISHELEIPQVETFVFNKLNYQVRENFLKKYIYNNIDILLKSENWNSFVSSDPEHDNQDVYFIYHACKAIHRHINYFSQKKTLSEFYKYLCEQVFLIVNLLEKDIKSEKLFINVNKGVKLKDEDLVKALLLTKIPLDNHTEHYRLSENEINEARSNLGRQWDELASWASRKELIDFLQCDFSNNNRLAWLIQLTYPNAKSNDLPYPIFTYLDNLYRAKSETATAIFVKIRSTMLMLNDWVYEPEICNLLGFILHSKKSIGLSKIWEELRICKTKNEILGILKSKCYGILPILEKTSELKELNYEDFKDEIFNLFLMLDISKFLPIGTRSATSYNFSNILENKWSIEHIFPQNYRDFKSLTKLSNADLQIIKELLPSKIKEIQFESEDQKEALLILYTKLQNSKNDCSIEGEERELLAVLLDKNARDLHKLGNLALLQHGMNSGLSNHFFDGKRKIMVRKISEGEFVPFHTYDVFSKLVIDSSTGLHIWSKEDIDRHEIFIKNQIALIINYLNIAV